MKMRHCVASWIALVMLGGRGLAIEPHEVFIIGNKNTPESRLVADHYCKARQVPKDNVIMLDLPLTEEITRTDYEEKMVAPLRAWLRDKRQTAKVLLSVWGVPLRVGPVPPDEREKRELAEVGKQLDDTRQRRTAAGENVKIIDEKVKQLESKALKEELEKARREYADLQQAARVLEERWRVLKHAESEAAVDSELMLLWWPEFPKHRWIVNPLYWEVSADVRRRFPQTLMAARLDGPNYRTAIRIVDDAIAAEKQGLKGIVYVDARGRTWDKAADPAGTDYGGFDESLREMAKLLEEKGALPVIMDNQEPLFPVLSCPDCALYCGWYSVSNYVPCCKFNTGAIALHIASFEAVSLREPRSQWCGNLLKDGVCVTMGPVAEPYTVAFPKPAEIFGFIVTGELPLIECYSRSLLVTSWMMTLVGDPLYNPYKNNKRFGLDKVLASPIGRNLRIAH